MSISIGELTGTITLEDRFSNVLELVVHQAEANLGELTGIFGLVAVSAAAVGTAILGVSGTIIALGMHGSEVNDLEEGFNTLAGSVENAHAIMEAMNKGVADTVDSTKLLTFANKALSTGAVKTAEDFGTITAAARVLSRQGFGPIEQQLNTIQQAMATGRLKTLQYMTGLIDVKEAERKYADSINVSVKALGEQGRLHAIQQAVIEKLNEKVQQAGDLQKSFAEKITTANLSIVDWFTNIAKAVAKSPEVNRALDAIGAALVENFGQKGQKAADVIIDFINGFANLMTYWGPIIVKGFRFIADSIKNVYDAVLLVWDLVPDWLKAVGKGALYAADQIWRMVGGLQTLANLTALPLLLKIAEKLGAISPTRAIDDQKSSLEQLMKGRSNLSASDLLMSSHGGPGGGGGSDIDQEKVIAATKAGYEQLMRLDNEYAVLVKKNAGDEFAAKMTALDGWFDAEKRKLDESFGVNKHYNEDLLALTKLRTEKETEILQDAAQQNLEMLAKNVAASRKIGTEAEAAVTKGFAGQPKVLEDMARSFGTVRLEAKQTATGVALIGTEASRMAQDVVDANNTALHSLRPLTAETVNFIRQLYAAGMTAEQIAEKYGIALSRVYEALAKSPKALGDALSELSGAFAELAQISGDSLSPVVQGVGQMVATLNTAKKAMDLLKESATTGFAEMASAATIAITAMLSLASIIEKMRGPSIMSMQLSITGGGNTAEIMAKNVSYLHEQIGSQEKLIKLYKDGVITLTQLKALLEPGTSRETLARTLQEISDTLRTMNEELERTNKLLGEAADKFGSSGNQLKEIERHSHDIFDAMVKDGTFTQDQLNKAYLQWQRDLAAAGDVAAKAWLKVHDAQAAGLEKSSAALEKLKGEYDSLAQSVAGEAPEEHMGVLEAAARGRMATIQTEMEAERARLNAIPDDLGDKLETVVDRTTEQVADKTTENLNEGFDNSAEHAETVMSTSADHIEVKFAGTAEAMKASLIDRTAEAAGEVESRLNGIRANDIHVQIVYDDPGAPVSTRSGGGRAGISSQQRGHATPQRGDSDFVEQAEGTHGVAYAEGPMAFTTQGDEYYEFFGEGKGSPRQDSGGDVIQVYVGGKIVKEVVMDELEMRPNNRDVKVLKGVLRR